VPILWSQIETRPCGPLLPDEELPISVWGEGMPGAPQWEGEMSADMIFSVTFLSLAVIAWGVICYGVGYREGYLQGTLDERPKPKPERGTK
jgi:hypothetical protein